MLISKTFSEGLYLYWCDIREDAPGMFTCTVNFANTPGELPLVTKQFKMNGAFATTEAAMGAGERYGRAVIRKHGDVVHYLAKGGRLDQ
jgi:hypothetical protein